MLSFRRTAPSDLDAVLNMEQRFSAFVGQWTRETHLAALDDPSSIAHLLFYHEEEPLAGYAILRGLNLDSRSIELMRIAMGSPDKGYGRQALALTLGWCFGERKAHRVWLDVRAQNTRAQHVYKAMGFTLEGVLRDAICVNGAFESLMVMSLLEDEYRRLFLIAAPPG